MPTSWISIPGQASGPSIQPRNIFATINPAFSPVYDVIGTKWLAGALTRDTGQTYTAANFDGSAANVTTLIREGTLLGKYTTDSTNANYGMYGNAIIGLVTTAYTSATTNTTLVTTTACVTEVLRRMGTNGSVNLYLVGPPTTTGTVAALAVTATQSGTTASTITFSGTATIPSANLVVGSLVCPGDTTYVPITVLSRTPLACGMDMTDISGNNLNQTFSFLRGASLIASQIPFLTQDDYGNKTNAMVEAWIKSKLNSVAGVFTFDDDR